MGDRIIEKEDFEDYLKQHSPYHVVQSGMKNNPKYATRFRIVSNGEFICPDSHQKPRIQVGHCLYGCYSCIAVEQISDNNYNIYCRYYYKESGENYVPIFVTRIY